MKLAPAVPSDLIMDCFDLAREIRELDMRASPYDLSALGLQPVRIETPAGRAEYAAAQRGFAERGQALRRRLIAACDHLLLSSTADQDQLTRANPPTRPVTPVADVRGSAMTDAVQRPRVKDRVGRDRRDPSRREGRGPPPCDPQADRAVAEDPVVRQYRYLHQGSLLATVGTSLLVGDHLTTQDPAKIAHLVTSGERRSPASC
jgi:hypothetical protein